MHDAILWHMTWRHDMMPWRMTWCHDMTLCDGIWHSAMTWYHDIWHDVTTSHDANPHKLGRIKAEHSLKCQSSPRPSSQAPGLSHPGAWFEGQGDDWHFRRSRTRSRWFCRRIGSSEKSQKIAQNVLSCPQAFTETVSDCVHKISVAASQWGAQPTIQA